MTAIRATGMSVSEPTRYVGFELSAKEWKLAMTSGFGVAPWIQTVPAGDQGAVKRVLTRARARLHLPATAGVVSCYEAGRDGFWIHRALTVMGLTNRVVDSASIEVNRRARRAKTDRIDAQKRVMMLVRVCQGERAVWREVRVPSVAADSVRHGSRERRQLKQEETRLVNQMRSWITTWGGRLPKRRVGDWWTTVADWSGAVLPAPVQARLARGQARLTVITAQLGVLDQAPHTAVAAAPPASPLRRLVQLKGVAATGATGLLEEGLVWRAFRSARHTAPALLIFCPVSGWVVCRRERPSATPSVAAEHRALERVREPGLDVIGVEKPELAGNLPDLGLLVARDRIVGRRYREQAIEQLAALGVGGDLAKLAGDEEVFRAPEERVLALGDLDHEDRLRRWQVAHALEHVDHLGRLDLADMKIGAGYTAQHIGERRQVACAIRVKMIQFADDPADGIRVTGVTGRGRRVGTNRLKPVED
jgi:transposase